MAQKHPAIVIVEDNPDIGRFVKDLLTSERPYQALVVDNGVRALEAVQSIKAQLIIMDYQLPGLNGLQIYDLLQEDPNTRGIAVLFMSAFFPKGNRFEDLGIEYLQKPFEIDELLDKVDKLLDNTTECTNARRA